MSEKLQAIGEAISAGLPGAVTGYEIAFGELNVYANAADIVKIVRFLRDDPRCQFWNFIDVTAVDYPQREQRFDVVYHFLSPKQNARVRVKVATDETTPVPSIIGEFPGADWFEREAYDLYGVLFTGHPDMRRILTDYGFEGHPLRKDFPAHRLCRGALRRFPEARGLRAGAAQPGIPQFRFSVAVGRHRLPAAGRREGERPGQQTHGRAGQEGVLMRDTLKQSVRHMLTVADMAIRARAA